MENSSNFFQRLETALVKDPETHPEKENDSYKFTRMLTRSVIALTVLPTFVITYIVNLINARAWYVLLLLSVYFTVFIFYTEWEFDWVISKIRNVQRYLYS